MVLKEQVAKLKEELAVSRRLDWIKRGIYGTETMKGGPLLQRGFGPSSAGGTNFNLNVEVKRDGSATVTSPTNAPAPKK
jgi:hypothetical protein